MVTKRYVADSMAVRHENAGRVLTHLVTHGASSRAELADRLNLSRSSLSTLVPLLTEAGYIREAGAIVTGAGRPRTQVELNPDSPRVAALEVNSVGIRATTADITGQYRSDISHPLPDSSPQTIISAITDIASSLCNDVPPIRSFAVAVSGPVSATRREVLMSSDLGWTKPVDLYLPIHDIFADIPIVIENNAALAAFAHAWELGNSSEHITAPSLLTLHTHPGIGCGIVLDGELFQPPIAFGSEAGHIWVGEPAVIPCGCTITNCLSSVASPEAMAERFIPHSPLPLEDRLAKLANAVTHGDARACQIIEECAIPIAHVIDSVRLIVGPVPAVLSGYWEEIQSVLLPAVQRHTECAGGMNPSVEAGHFGKQTVIKGSIRLAIQRLARTPLHTTTI